MNKTLKLVSPVILILFFCGLFAEPGWTETTPSSEVTSVITSGKILPDIYTVTKAERKNEFEIKAKFLKVTGIDAATSKEIVQPISDIGQINLILPEGFTLSKAESLEGNIFSYKIMAPKTAGDYQIKFEIPSEAWEYSYKMKIVTGFFKNGIAIFGFALCGTIIASNKDLSANGWGGGGNFLLVIGGAIVGSIFGAWIGDKLDENYYVYRPFE